MTIATMPKKQVPARLDTEILEALKLASEEAQVSIAKYLEDVLIRKLQDIGKLPMDFSPSKPQWGGLREPKQKKKSNKKSIADLENN